MSAMFNSIHAVKPSTNRYVMFITWPALVTCVAVTSGSDHCLWPRDRLKGFLRVVLLQHVFLHGFMSLIDQNLLA